MAFWKPSVASLTAFFERESRQEHRRDNNRSDDKSGPDSPRGQPGDAKGNLSSPRHGATDEFDAMVRDMWNEIVRHVRDSQSGSIDEIFTAAGDNLKNKMSVNVAQEVYKRELIAVLEALHTLRTSKGGNEACVISEEQATINSLKRRLKDVTEDAKNAKEVLKWVTKEKGELEYICEEHEEKRRKLAKLLKAAEKDNEELRANVSSLSKANKGLEVDVERLLAVRSAVDVEMLKAHHKAELAEMVAKQESLRCKKLEEQLKKAESSSDLVHKHVAELERVLQDMTGLLNNITDNPEQPRSHWMGGQVESLIHKSSRLLGRFGISRSRDRDEDRSPVNDGDRNGATVMQARDAILEDPPAPRIGKKWSLGLLSNPNNGNGDDTNPGLFHRITSRFRREGSGEHSDTEIRKGKVNSSRNNERAERRASGNERQEADCTRSANSKLVDLRRILSRSTQSNHRSQVRCSDPQAIEYMSKTLEALEKNLESLRDVVDFKDEELHHLNRKLRDAVKLSDAFEKGLKQEFQKRMEAEEMLAAKGGESTGCEKGSSVLKKSADTFGKAESSVRDKVTVRWSCRWF